jgi:hypothetical protein
MHPVLHGKDMNTRMHLSIKYLMGKCIGRGTNNSESYFQFPVQGGTCTNTLPTRRGP